MLGMRGECSEVSGHEGTAAVGVVGISGKFSVAVGPDFANGLEDEEKSLVRLFFFVNGFDTAG